MLYWGKVNKVVSASVFEITLDLGFELHTPQRVYLDTPWVAEGDAEKAVHCLVMMVGGKRLLVEVTLGGNLRTSRNAPCFPAELLVPVPAGADLKPYHDAGALVSMNGIPGGTYPESCLVVSRMLLACKGRDYATDLLKQCYRWRVLANGQARE